MGGICGTSNSFSDPEVRGRIRKGLGSISTPLQELPWTTDGLSLTATGEALLEACQDWLSLGPGPRWIAGVLIRPGASAWRWAPDEHGPVEI